MNDNLLDPRAEETRRRLIDAGLALFGRQGFDAVTTRELAELAKVNQAAIPYHFGGKEGVYLAVADYIASLTSRQMAPIAAFVRQRLAGQPARQELAALLLDTTVAIARVVFDPGHRTAWFTFLTREQFYPSPAFTRLYEDFTGPLHALIGELIARLTGAAAETPETILLTHAYLGQIIGFASARATLNRRLGRAGLDEVDADRTAIIAAIERFSRLAIAGMAGAGQTPAGRAP